MVGTNTGLISQAVIPFGGIKESGIGASKYNNSIYVLTNPHRSRGCSWHPGVHEHQVHCVWRPLSPLCVCDLTTLAETCTITALLVLISMLNLPKRCRAPHVNAFSRCVLGSSPFASSLCHHLPCLPHS
jgi:hypothetical protein